MWISQHFEIDNIEIFEMIEITDIIEICNMIDTIELNTHKNNKKSNSRN